MSVPSPTVTSNQPVGGSVNVPPLVRVTEIENSSSLAQSPAGRDASNWLFPKEVRGYSVCVPSERIVIVAVEGSTCPPPTASQLIVRATHLDN